MNDHETDPPRDETALAILDLAAAIREQTRALGGIARESAAYRKTAQHADNAARQAVQVANEVRAIAEDLRGGIRLELDELKEHLASLENPKATNGNGHG